MDPFGHLTTVTRLDRSGARAALDRSSLSARPAPAAVADLMPVAFPAHARVLPRLPIPVDGRADERRWGEVLGGLPPPGSAVRAVRAMAPDAIVRIGGVDRPTVARLAALLGPATTTPESCYFHFSGRSFVAIPDPDDDQELVYEGPVAAATDFVTGQIPMYETPTTIWPADGAWCVALWTDAVAAYVGGTGDLIARLCADDSIEADEVFGDAPIDDWTAR